MFGERAVEVQKDVEATLVPSGVKVTVRQGTQVFVTQAMGDSYTVYVNGNLVRIAGKDGDALGLVILELPDINQQAMTVEEKIWTQLKTCFDPEIPVNIVDLGLVYNCQINAVNEQSYAISIVMTLTAPGCGMGPILVNEVEEKIRMIDGVTNVDVQLVFDPPWDKSMMTDEAKLQMGLL